MKYFFVARLHGLTINQVLNRGIRVLENLRVTNNKSIIESRSDDFFKTMLGKLEYNSLLQGPFVYAEGDYEDDSENVENGRLEFLNYYLRLCQTVGTSLWLTKDNSVRTELGFLYVYDKKLLTIQSVSSNMRTTQFVDCKGGNEDTVFSVEEINDSIKLYTDIFGENTNADLDHYETSKIITMEANRLERFVYFLQSTRTQGFPPGRIAMYCMLLETLLSTSKAEIGHQLAERTALLLGKGIEEREKIYKFIKDAYSVRSANFHGDKLPRKYRSIEKQTELCIEFDNYIRRLFKIIFTNSEITNRYKSNDENTELNKWFNELIFS
ncbi:hypothetical protein JYA63_03455 [Fictibacillus nanhaiensis]|uniref:Apea-like HEPN domain-containing protein n=1 Tax=Fictibacillus nanhaiensis TaxID=742169 RepID=A0ABS2ZM77_9BACL|nr:hypothetical protein [Fictibacillus nanhaiensis]